jgi:hypothetical protein
MEQHTSQTWEIIHLLMRQQKEREREDFDKVVETLRTVPTAQETLEALCALGPTDADRALRSHPGYAGQRCIESIHSMLQLFHCALFDLEKAIAAFPDLRVSDHRITREALEGDLSVRVNKEFYAAIGAAKSLVEMSRGFRDSVEGVLFRSKLDEIFDEEQHEFVVKLRNVVHHQVHSKANWQQTWDEQGQCSHFVLQREEILADNNLNVKARAYLERIGPTCDLVELLREYASKLDRFYAWLLSHIETTLAVEIVDYRKCRKALQLDQGRKTYTFLIEQWIQAGVDPYSHLSKHLTPEQLKTIRLFPDHSAHQVDYLIAAMDKDELCDDKLRELAYRFFGVRDRKDQR